MKIPVSASAKNKSIGIGRVVSVHPYFNSNENTNVALMN